MHGPTLDEFIENAASERDLKWDVIRALLRDFLRSLHEIDFKSGYYSGMGGIEQVYFLLGPEAAFHFVELLARGGRGHDPDDTQEMLQRLDPHAYRYSTTVQRWQAEIDKDLADRDDSSET
nr:hypothetical protein [uncultured Rhodopila sp.]